MEVGNCRLVLNKLGSDVPRDDVTPAECMFLHIVHGPNNGGKTFGEDFNKIQVTGQALVDTGKLQKKVTKPAVAAVYKDKVLVTAAQPEEFVMEPVLRDRTNVEELARLRKKYVNAKTKDNKLVIDQVWPDRMNPKLPATFKELNWQEIGGLGFETASLNYVTGNVKTE